ncbi:MAG: hypothetical protein ACRDRL_07870 [Sciscionella sp.]
MTAGAEAGGLGRAVIYAVGTPGMPGTEVPALRAYVAYEGWPLVDICFDRCNASHPADRPGLRAALDRLRFGFAAVLVLDHVVYAEMPEPSWLDAAVRACGSSLHHVLPAAGESAIAHGSADVGSDARLAVRPYPVMPILREAG